MTLQDIEILLPQTQCRQCGYDGCAPYAQAMATDDAPINLCTPGGEIVMHELAQLLHKSPMSLAQAEKAAAPKVLAVIDEANCIGCTACIKACPVDAIVGASKYMHTVLADECTGCELCLPPCPVDCIELLPVADAFLPRQGRAHAQPRRAAAEHAAMRHRNRQNRLQRLADEKRARLEAHRRAAVRANPSSHSAEKAAVAPAVSAAALIAQAMAKAQAQQNQRRAASNHDDFRRQSISDAQEKATYRRAMRDMQYGDEAQKAAALAYLREHKEKEEKANETKS